MTNLKLKIEFYKMGQLKRATEIMLKEPDQFRDFKREVENQLVKGSETDTHFFVKFVRLCVQEFRTFHKDPHMKSPMMDYNKVYWLHKDRRLSELF